MSIRKWGTTLAAWTLFAGVLLVVPASAESKARIVRLSEVQGSVQMDRATGDGYDKTFLNMPVVEGSRLKTGDDGRAERYSLRRLTLSLSGVGPRSNASRILRSR